MPVKLTKTIVFYIDFMICAFISARFLPELFAGASRLALYFAFSDEVMTSCTTASLYTLDLGVDTQAYGKQLESREHFGVLYVST